MNNVLNEQLLADKFSKLNSTQQCIETLSHLCIFHQNKAELVVSTWSKQFHNSEMELKVPLLYLANDILQNSKRKGTEYVAEFWKVLPAALKHLNEIGDEKGKKAVSRLVGIWEDRRVFGSRKSLKEMMLAEELPPPLDFSKKRSRSVRILKRDSRSIRTKLSIGGTAERIVSAYHLVLSENSSEDTEMNKCKSAVHHVRKMEHDVNVACSNAKDPKRKSLAKELEEEEKVLKQCIEKLKSIEANRVALVSHLKEALHEQESELENVRTQMQVAQAQVDEVSAMHKRLLSDETYAVVPKSYNATTPTATPPTDDTNTKSRKTAKKTTAAIAAEVADKLAASTSSQYIMSSVLSSFAAEEAKSVGLAQTSTVSNNFTNSMTSPAMPVSDPNTFMQAQPQPQPLSVQPSNLYQSVPPNMQIAQYQILPNPSSQQYMQQNSAGIIMAPYGYATPPLPPGPPPPLPPHMMGQMMPLNQQQMQVSQPQPVSAVTQQPPAPPSFRPLQPTGMVYYTQPHQPQ